MSRNEDEIEKALVNANRRPKGILGRLNALGKGKHPLEIAGFILLCLTLLATTFAAFYTGKQQDVMRKQWQAMQDQAKLMRDQEIQQLRGYVFALPKSGSINNQSGTVEL